MLSTALVRPFHSFSFLLFILAVNINSVSAQQGSPSTCADVHLFLARGRAEPYPGRIGAIVDATCGGLSNLSCDYEDIAFTSVDGSLYCDSIGMGVIDGIAQIKSYSSRCPNAKLVLGGYSEGAHIVGDILGSGGGTFYNCVENNEVGLSPSNSPGSKIAAAVIFGDPRHTASESYNVGTGSNAEGEYPRTGSQLANLNLFSANIQSYCLITDPICALGNDGLSHTTYMTVYASTAGAWIQKIVTSGSSGDSAAAASKSAAAASSAAAAASASASAASQAVASAASAAAAASSSASAASAAAASASGAASVSAASVASVAAASAASAASVASAASAQVASASAASASQVSASIASVASASAASAASASLAQTTTYALPSDVGPTAVTSKPTLQSQSTSTATSGVEAAQTTSSKTNGASGLMNVDWFKSLAIVVVVALAAQ